MATQTRHEVHNAASLDAAAEEIIDSIDVGQGSTLESPMGSQIEIDHTAQEEWIISFRGSTLRGSRTLALHAVRGFLKMESFLCSIAAALGCRPTRQEPQQTPRALLN